MSKEANLTHREWSMGPSQFPATSATRSAGSPEEQPKTPPIKD
jgi:hypothetical protein